MRSIAQRLERLEHRPESMFPRFIIEYEDGHRENFTGADLISHYAGIRRITYDAGHQPSVDTAALYSMLHPQIETVPIERSIR